MVVTYHVLGRTYPWREWLKENFGAQWDPVAKVWVLEFGNGPDYQTLQEFRTKGMRLIEQPSLRAATIKLAMNQPSLRQHLVPILRKTAEMQTSPTPDGAKGLFQRYKEKHPGTKKNPRDFYAPSSNKSPKKTAPPKGDMFSAVEKKLPPWPSQKIKDRDALFKVAGEAHEHQLDWLNRGKGLDSILGVKAVRGDKGDPMPDFSKPGPVVLIGPLKGAARSEEKVKSVYDGDWSQLTDIVRASVAVDSMDEIHDVMRHLRKSGLKLAGKPNDRFAEPTEAGYRDLNLRVEYPNGHVGELQIHLKPILQAKDEGHKYYEETRSISAKAKAEGRTTMTPEEQKAVDSANAKMRALYDKAWAQATGKTASRKMAAETKYYLFEGQPAKWEKGKFPVLVQKGKEKPLYELEKFFQGASAIDQKKFDALVQGKGEKS